MPVDQLAVHEPDYKNLIAFLKAMEFSTITRRVAEKSGIDASQIEADGKLTSASLLFGSRLPRPRHVAIFLRRRRKPRPLLAKAAR